MKAHSRLTTHDSSPTVLLAAGGTGGHIFPAVALAEVLRARGMRVELVTDHRFHHYTRGVEGVLAEMPIHTIRASGLSGGILKKILSLVGIALGVVQALVIIRRVKPVAVVGFGGYPSLPTMLAAIALHRRTIIHEQNSVLGRVNRMIAARVDVVATTYKETQRMPVSTRRVVGTGNPVRAAVRAVADVAYPTRAADDMLRVMVLGGSQGASVFSAVLPEAMALLPADVRARVRLDQQCRAGEMDATRARYAELNMQVDLAPFFIDVAARLASAHLIITRSGASTVAELMVVGRPALLVPLPSAMDNHQYFNAEAVEDAGAGWVMTQEAFTAQALAAKIETLMRNPQRLADCAAAMRTLAAPNAAEKLADLVVGDK
jgi:UDP-N-acetylglucosamine--N-acetylmuramyl-(pentapeptide) pyrophosphoryl-undecaprenol N-acetylglucosamine transferase